VTDFKIGEKITSINVPQRENIHEGEDDVISDNYNFIPPSKAENKKQASDKKETVKDILDDFDSLL